MQESPSNYPTEYVAQEKELMKQISARRKAYMMKMNNAERLFSEGDKPLFREDGHTDQTVVNKLFK